MRRTVAGVCVVALAVVLPAIAGATVKKRLVATFSEPVQVVGPPWAPRSTIYVAERGGRVLRWQNGHRHVVLDLSGQVTTAGQEQGLLSIAFKSADRVMFVYFTNRRGDSRVVRYRLGSGGGHVRSGPGHTVLRVSQPAANHNGGTLQFRDGHLYLSLGDGGGACNSAAPGSAQDLGSKLGKLLRRDRTGWKIVGYGLRNPWRWSFDRKTGDLYIGDVGQNTHEEVDFLRAAKVGLPAENYGWNHYEGKEANTCGSLDEGINPAGELIVPKIQYGHPGGEVVVGGFVYRGAKMPAQRGRYFYGDEIDGWVRTADAHTLRNRTKLAFQVSHLDSFGESSRGELYAVSLDGPVYRLVDK